MYVINANNINDAYPQGLALMRQRGEPHGSRAGGVLELGSVTTRYQEPCRRVLFDAARDANPFFHLFEALWMLAGREDVALPATFVARMKDYSDDGQNFHSAYGHRWRAFFGRDQLRDLRDMLAKDPSSRRAVLGIWSPEFDLAANSKDLPCNIGAKLEIRQGALNLYVFNRSNDMLWGAYGANVVQFSMLQEYMARWLGVQVGFYEQISTNFHVYLEEWRKRELDQMELLPATSNPYDLWVPFPLLQSPAEEANFMVDTHEGLAWVQGVRAFNDKPEWRTAFWQKVAGPMAKAHLLHRQKNTASALRALDNPDMIDWLAAGKQWLQRRYNK